jgi:uncharacterized membrane protein YccC
MTKVTRSRWFLPLFCVAMGIVLFVAAWIGDDPGKGAFFLAVLAGFGVLRGDGRDERFRMIDVHATAIAGTVLITVLIGAWIVELARGRDGEPYTQLMAVGGVAYLAAVALLRWRG